jgi:CYTH domain-containing protein
VQWIVEKLEERKAEADAALEDATDGRFERLEARFGRALGSYTERIQLRRDGSATAPPPFADALAPRVRNQATELEQHLNHVRSPRDEEEGHEARIAAKRLRYLLEPVLRVVPGTAEVVERLKALQDILGDLHDAQVFGAEITGLAVDAALGGEPNAVHAPAPRSVVPARRSAASQTEAQPATAASEPVEAADAQPAAVQTEGAPETGAAPAPTAGETPAETPAGVPADAPPTAGPSAPAIGGDLGPGIDAINQRLRARSTAAFGQFTAEWLGDRSAPFFRDLEAVIERIAAAAREGLEIERKYLLSYVPEVARDSRWVDIAQGYVPGSRLNERVRRVSVHHGSGRKEVHFYRTVKLGEGVSRIEVEEETTEPIFLAMWALTRRHRLRKRRYEVEVDGRTWEIDQFRNRNLVLAEIELGSEDEEVTFPDWLAPAVQREVTGEPEFQNINLAR